jgi:CheY-like chemotaxis protein
VLPVIDDGIGIDPELLPRIFDIFAQGDTSRSRDGGGLGIGLYLVQRLVDMHGGRITAQSPGVGEGSRFTIYLPLLSHDDVEQHPVQEETSTPAPGGEKRRVLVVDDNPDAANTIAQAFRISGHEVRIAHNGVEAIKLASKYRPHAIFMDIGLPDMDGCDAAAKMRERPEFDNVLLVALSGYGREQDIQRSRQAGFDEHLVKPSRWRQLEAALARCGLPRGKRVFRGPTDGAEN